MSASSQPVSSSGAAAQQQPAAGTLSNNAPVDSVALLTQEAQLTAPDSVMEVNVLDVLKEYMKAGGKVQTAVQDLSDGYMGLAHMAELMCEWTELVEMPLTGLVGSGSSTATTTSSTLNRAYSSIGSSKSLMHSSGAAAAAPASSVGTDGLDVLLLQELVKERFDPTRFLSVFKKGHPEWLDQLIQHKACRKMIYELSAANKNSLLLNYAIQRILKQGHEDEVAQVGSSLASYFDVYHRLLASRLAAAARATDKKQLRSIASDIVESSVGNQHTYVHAQQLLTALAQLPGGGVFRRLSQEVEVAAAERHGGAKVYQLQPLFVPRSASPLECRAVQLVSDVLVKSSPREPGSGSAAETGGSHQQPSFNAGQLTAAEQPLLALQRLYQQEIELSVQPLRHPRMLQLLLSGMYVASDTKPQPGSNHGCSMQELSIRLLALAVAGRSSQQQQQQQQDPQAGADQGSQQQQPEHRRSLSPEVKVAVGVDAVAARLRESLALSKKMASTKLWQRDLDAATQVCQLPVAALGLLQHSQLVLGGEAVYAEEKLVVVVPNHLSVLHRVACEQPGFIPQVLDVLHSVLVALGASHPELTKSVLSFLVSLIVSGAAAPTLHLAQEWSKQADPSLLRHFIELVLDSVEPPYSEGFARVMLVMLDQAHIKRVQSSHTAMLREFAMGCRDIPYRPPLNNDLQGLLESLGNL